MEIRRIFGVRRPLIGVIHLLPLPGSPGWRGDLKQVMDKALQDLEALEEGGAHGAIVENFGDRPFPKKATLATLVAMAVVVERVAQRARIPIGVNVLRSDGEAAMAIASLCGAAFIRVNVFCGVALTDQGLMEGEAHRILSLRRSLGAEVAVLADVHVKHAFHFGTIAAAARDAARNKADALIITGGGTGEEASPEDLESAKEASGLPVLVGSGITPENVSRFARADGFIVGTYLKEGGETEAPVDPRRVAEMAEAIASLP